MAEEEMAGEVDDDRPRGPYARVHLPDGQDIYATVRGREQDPTGAWWYTLEIVVPDRLPAVGGPVQQGRVISFTAGYPTVEPIEGQDYSVLNPDRQASGPPGRWRVSIDRDGLEWVHRSDCAQAGDTWISDQDALTRLSDPERARPCPVCRPEAVLQTLPYAPEG
ncbi:DUF6233 domain-containing protein [Streptomyces sp. NPDC042319]|uniref:DUF6233 domain-containing protein n=1 Tax=Streptomyces sp. NPDC042319 TaxID=3154332 RepID=UPI0034117A08